MQETNIPHSNHRINFSCVDSCDWAETLTFLIYPFCVCLCVKSIADEVMSEMKTAMKAKDTVTLSTTRLIRASFANAAIELKADKLTDEQVRGVVFQNNMVLRQL
jgi:hypothetical protein